MTTSARSWTKHDAIPRRASDQYHTHYVGTGGLRRRDPPIIPYRSAKPSPKVAVHISLIAGWRTVTFRPL